MYKILIVEDDTTISTIIEEKLNKWGYITLKLQNFEDIMPDFTFSAPSCVNGY